MSIHYLTLLLPGGGHICPPHHVFAYTCVCLHVCIYDIHRSLNIAIPKSSLMCLAESLQSIFHPPPPTSTCQRDHQSFTFNHLLFLFGTVSAVVISSCWNYQIHELTHWGCSLSLYFCWDQFMFKWSSLCHLLLFGRVLCHGTNPHSREWKGQPLPIHTLTHWHNTHARSHFGGQTYDSPFLSVLIRSGAIAPAAIILSDPILQLRLLTPPLTHSP